MDDLTKYEEMRSNGESPHQVYLVAKTDGLDAIKQIWLIRKLFGLSLAEAKQATEAGEAWSEKPVIAPGAIVYWEGWSTEEGFYLMQARVKDMNGDNVSLENHRKFSIANDGLNEVPVEGPRMASLRLSYLEQPLSVRLENLVKFVEKLSYQGSAEEAGRKVV